MKDDETGIDPKATDGEPHDPADPNSPPSLEAARRRRGSSMAERGENGDGEPEPDEGEQTELPLDIPGARKPSLTMNARGKPVSVEGKMRGKSFRMSGIVDDTDRIIEARVLIRFHKDQRVPQRDGTGETAHTTGFIVRQEFDVLRMDVLDAVQPVAADA